MEEDTLDTDSSDASDVEVDAKCVNGCKHAFDLFSDHRKTLLITFKYQKGRLYFLKWYE